MKRYLLYLTIIALGTLIFTSPNQARDDSKRTGIVENASAQTPPAPVQAAVASQLPPATPQAAPAVQTASTQAVAPAPAPQPAPAPAPNSPDAIMASAGLSPSDYQYADYIISHESGWCSTKWEGEIGVCPGSYIAVYSPDYTYKGYGLCQSTPAIKMSAIAGDWATNPVTQLRWCTQYAVARYGSWYGAYIHWINNHNW